MGIQIDRAGRDRAREPSQVESPFSKARAPWALAFHSRPGPCLATWMEPDGFGTTVPGPIGFTAQQLGSDVLGNGDFGFGSGVVPGALCG